MSLEQTRLERFERNLASLLSRYGAHGELAPAITRAVEQTLEALASSSEDGASLTALDVVRVRMNKFAAAQLPPAVFRDARHKAALRAELLRLAQDFLGDSSTRFSRFGGLPET